MSPKVTIYTAIYGQKNELIDPVWTDKRCRYICFTDDINVNSKIWQVVYYPSGQLDSTRAAKIFKVLSHVFFPKELTVWMDGSIQIVNKKAYEGIFECLSSHYLWAFKTGVRKTVAEEVEYCIKNKKDETKVLKEQLNRYKMSGFTNQIELFNGSFILRDNSFKETIFFNRAWWQEILSYSKRDEVSLPYVVWKTKTNISALPWPTRYDCPYIKIEQHLK